MTTTIKSPWVKLYDDVTIPTYAHEGDAAQDLRLHLTPDKLSYLRYYENIYDGPNFERFIYACTNGFIELKPGEWFLFPTGLAVEIPRGAVMTISPRSGLGGKGFTINNSPGIIDSGYRYKSSESMAEVFVAFKNSTGTKVDEFFIEIESAHNQLVQAMTGAVYDRQLELDLPGFNTYAGESKIFSNGDRIAQAMFLPFLQVEQESPSAQRSGGLGSSGMK